MSRATTRQKILNISKSRVALTRALWAQPLGASEKTFPARRILHARTFQFESAHRVERIGIVRAHGGFYGSEQPPDDWITSLRVLNWNGRKWEEIAHRTGLRRPQDGRTIWLETGAFVSRGLSLEIRATGVDAGWSGWDMAEKSFVVEARPVTADIAPDTSLRLAALDFKGLPRGLSAEHLPGEIRFRSKWLEVGFSLARTGFSYLSVDGSGKGRTHADLIRRDSRQWDYLHEQGYGGTMNLHYNVSGLRLHPVGVPAEIGFTAHRVQGTTRVTGNRVSYDVTCAGSGVRYRIEWTVFPDRLEADMRRSHERPVRAWHSSLWHIPLNLATAIPTVLGAITREGEAGGMKGPTLLHFPSMGTLRAEAVSGGDDVLWRSDVWRNRTLATAEIKLAESPMPEGDYLLRAGDHRARMVFSLHEHRMSLKPGTPAVVRRAAQNAALSAVTWRGDVGALANNGASLHCIICADLWPEVGEQVGKLLPGLHARDLVRHSFQRFLDGGPFGLGGRYLDKNRLRLSEDKAVQSGAAFLLGLARFLETAPDAQEFFMSNRAAILRKLREARARDIDGDGLIECPALDGVSGSRKWGCGWWDVVSFGWKDAYSNALFYQAITKWITLLPVLGAPDEARNMVEWGRLMKASYTPTFFNPRTGWLAGWRDKKGKLHDHAFHFVNGAAVVSGVIDKTTARSIMRRLWKELRALNLPDLRFGLPGNFRSIPPEDMPYNMSPGVYENRSQHLAQTDHFVGALEAVGMNREANELMGLLLAMHADGSAFRGLHQGNDWRGLDGWPSGYEGILTDQFGILMHAIRKYRR